MVKARGDPEAAGQAPVASHAGSVVEEAHLARRDPARDAQASEARRHRVAVLAHADEPLAVDARTDGLVGVEGLGRQRPKQLVLAGKRVLDRL